MRTIRRAFARLFGTLRGHERAESDLHAEMEAHIAMATDENIRRGMRPDEARRKAMLSSGGLTQAAESVHEQRGLPWLEGIVADLRYAFRHFRRTRLSTITMIVVLSLGIGTTVVVFTVLNSVITLPSPGIARDNMLVRIRGTMQLRNMSLQARTLSWPEIQEYSARTETFSSVAAHALETAVLNTGDEGSSSITTNVVYATSNYFSILNVRPVLGSEPAREPDVKQMTTSPTAMISYGMWQQTFGGASDVIGRVVRVNNVAVEIVGVAPPRFIGTGGAGALTMWVPLAAYPQMQGRTVAVFNQPDSMFLSATARLRPDVTTKTATPVVASIASRLVQPGQNSASMTVPGSDVVLRGQVSAGSADVVPLLATNHRVSNSTDRLISIATVGGFALIVLLITCTNVSALMVGLATARRREIGVRLSLGAPRKRLIRQLLTESVVLALIAAAIGLAVTAIGIRAAGSTFEDLQLVVDWRVTLATCSVAIITGILFGLSPALHATRVSVGEVLKGSATAVSATRSKLQRALVVAQITLTQPLLVGLGVLIVTMVTDMGARATSGSPEQIAEIELDIWASNLPVEARAELLNSVVERVAAMPGVVAAMPAQMGSVGMPLIVHPADRIPGRTYEQMVMRMTAAPKGYFEAFEIPIVRGRDFDSAERVPTSSDAMQPQAFDAVIIGSDLARRLWGEADPLGRRLSLSITDRSDSLTLTVVGVVDEVAAGPSDVNGETRAYIPYSPMNSGVIARTVGPAAPMMDEFRAAVTTAAPQMPIYRAETMAQREAAFRRQVMRASGFVAGGGLLALLLSAIGLYAVVSFAVGQRSREIGIRTALGAQSGQVVRMFFVNGLALSAFGLVLGLPLSMFTVRMISKTLNWPLTTSPVLGVLIGAVVLGVASLAVWIPSRRASRIDPILALRTE